MLGPGGHLKSFSQLEILHFLRASSPASKFGQWPPASSLPSVLLVLIDVVTGGQDGEL